jgi:uncharacterized protein (DUF2267 family)
MEYGELITQVRTRMGNATAREAAHAVVATLYALAPRLRRVDAETVAERLPPNLAALLTSDRADGELGLESFYAEVARLEGRDIGFAMEHAQAVCQSLMHLLDAQARTQLSINVWPELVRPSLFDCGATFGRRLGSRENTLAGGRPGGEHPLSEATRTDTAHRESVVRADNPHAARKISSSR